MYKIRVGIREIRTKKMAKEMKPLFIWGLLEFVVLFGGALAGGDGTIFFLSLVLCLLGYIALIPITVVGYKKTAKYRNMPYEKTTLAFDVLDGEVYMNGNIVHISMNAAPQFIIRTGFLEGYSVIENDTMEFLEFVEANGIPYKGLDSHQMEEVEFWVEEINDVGNWFEFEFNEPYKGKEITSINGVRLPEQYLNFMREYNGGVGDIGETWFLLYPLEELEEINDGSGMEQWLPNHIIIGSNGGGELYGIDSQGNYFNVPAIIEKDCIHYLGNDINQLPDRINEMWRNM